MHWLRFPITAALLASLVFSDLATFWHLGNCCVDHGRSTADVGAGPTEVSGCSAGCSHQRNPFAARRAAAAKANADRSAVTESACSDCKAPADGDPRDHEHDSDRCSLCRWLVTARDAAVGWSVAPHSELSPIEWAPIFDWESPALTPQFHELSRRGPPADFLLS